MESDPQEQGPLHPIGEDLGMDIGRSVARHANSRVGGSGDDTHISLSELGEHKAKDVRFRDSAKQGFLTAYVRSREAVSEHKTATTISISSIAIGAVLTGVYHLKYRKK
jgi:hypothetical protein